MMTHHCFLLHADRRTAGIKTTVKTVKYAQHSTRHSTRIQHDVQHDIQKRPTLIPITKKYANIVTNFFPSKTPKKPRTLSGSIEVKAPPRHKVAYIQLTKSRV